MRADDLPLLCDAAQRAIVRGCEPVALLREALDACDALDAQLTCRWTEVTKLCVANTELALLTLEQRLELEQLKESNAKLHRALEEIAYPLIRVEYDGSGKEISRQLQTAAESQAVACAALGLEVPAGELRSITPVPHVMNVELEPA